MFNSLESRLVWFWFQGVPKNRRTVIGALIYHFSHWPSRHSSNNDYNILKPWKSLLFQDDLDLRGADNASFLTKIIIIILTAFRRLARYRSADSTWFAGPVMPSVVRNFSDRNSQCIMNHCIDNRYILFTIYEQDRNSLICQSFMSPLELCLRMHRL